MKTEEVIKYGLNIKAGTNWYKSLNLNQKINLKECCFLITGMKWEALALFFSFKEIISILYKKLKLEGFNI